MQIYASDVAAAAKVLGLSVRRVQQLCAEGRLGQLVGDIYVMTAEELERFKAIPRPRGNPQLQKDKPVKKRRR